MDRRTFNKLASLGAIGALNERTELGNQHASLEPAPRRRVPWPTQTYRRLLIDTHVPDWDPNLLADFDAANYVATIAGAGFQSFMQYANSHVGLCLWRTKLGQMHAGMRGRDFFGEVMKECHRRGLHSLAYYSLIFDDWAYQSHPDWRILPEEGYDRILYSRTGTVCPNSPYREHSLACLRELVGNYDFEGIFLDMTFWPAVCYCPHCTERFWREHHDEPPRIVNWDDPAWRSFQRSREQWMLEFARTVTQTIQETRSISVYQQFATIFSPWQFAVSLEQSDASDFLGGDFYGGAAQFSLVCKAYHGLTRTRPFEFMTSRTHNLHDFETTKPLERILVESMVPTLHSAAYLLIDAIKPDGTLNPTAYQYFEKVNAAHDPYEPFLGGELLADVAIYYDKESMYDPETNGLHTREVAPAFAYGGPAKLSIESAQAGKNPPHLDAIVGIARILREAHIPFGVVTNVTLGQLSRYRAVVVPNVLEMTADQAAQFRKFVQDGGILYASGSTSLDRLVGHAFRLEDVLGVRYLGTVGTSTTYLSPIDSNLKKVIWPQQNVTFQGPMVQAESLPGSEVLATVTLPFVTPEVGYTIGTHFAQIWSNPPAMTPGHDPGIVINSFGKGKAIWAAAPIESETELVYANIVSHLLRRVLPAPYSFEVETNREVEMTLFNQVEKRRLLVSLLNMPEQVPAVPVGATVRVHMRGNHRPKRVLHLPDQKEMPFEQAGAYIQFRIAPFQILTMTSVEYD